jgi:hypothetical protein
MTTARTSRGFLAVAAMAIVAGGVAALVIFREGPPDASSSTVAKALGARRSVSGDGAPPHALPSGTAEPAKVLVPSPGPAGDGGSAAAKAARSPVIQKEPYQPGLSKFTKAKDPLARNALARVGADEKAEYYWLATINDPGIPAKERKDLIEDLNEDGISDPAHPAFSDLALITSRIQLIETLLPTAMDKVNADAFKEAHKDLVKMRERISQQ